MLVNKPLFDLTQDPWIPVLLHSGESVRVCLQECFSRANEISDLSLRPHEYVAVFRFLQCIFYAAQPEGVDWKGSWVESLSKIKTYLNIWHDRFFLQHDEFPFLQVKGLEPADSGKVASLSKLDCCRASGNNAMLWDHLGEEACLSDADTVIALITYQNFSLGGTSSQAKWKGVTTRKTALDSPCAASSMLHVFVRGCNLSETLRLNTPHVREFSHRYSHLGDGWFGRPVWEDMPQSINAPCARTFLGRLTPLSRAVLICQDGMIAGEGVAYPNFNSEHPFPQEPTATTKVVKKAEAEQIVLLGISPEKTTWRELGAVLAVRSTGQGARSPVALKMLAEGDAEFHCDILAMALLRDNAKIVDVVQSVYPLTKRLLTEIGLRDYETGVGCADRMASRLDRALFEYMKIVDQTLSRNDSGKEQVFEKLKAEQRRRVRKDSQLRFWTDVEAGVSLLFAAAGAQTDEQALAGMMQWKRHLSKCAISVYDDSCPRLGSRTQKAYVMGRRFLDIAENEE